MFKAYIYRSFAMCMYHTKFFFCLDVSSVCKKITTSVESLQSTLETRYIYVQKYACQHLLQNKRKKCLQSYFPFVVVVVFVVYNCPSPVGWQISAIRIGLPTDRRTDGRLAGWRLGRTHEQSYINSNCNYVRQSCHLQLAILCFICFHKATTKIPTKTDILCPKEKRHVLQTVLDQMQTYICYGNTTSVYGVFF